VPQTGRCDVVGCGEDKDCSSGAVCNTQTQLCEPRCRWDFQSGTVAAPGCPANQTCWVDAANLDPSSLFFGAGRCRPPCGSDIECTDTGINPNGGSGLVCRQDPELVGVKRCRANGCMDLAECDGKPTDAHSNGYCDLNTFACKPDCRIGTNPVTNKAYDDCSFGYKCSASGSTRTCIPKQCYELGGAATACNPGELCSGQDRTGDGLPDYAPSSVTPDTIGCYKAPSPPFCVKCTGNPDCAALGNVSGSKLPNLCATFQKPDMSTVNACVIATVNDPSLDATGIPKYYAGCPAGYSVKELRIDMAPSDQDHNCTSNADCGPSGTCGNDPEQRLKDGSPVKTCLCTTPGATGGQCPNNSACRVGLNPQEVCLITVACWPSGENLFGTSNTSCKF
jgi:hypothetical protein